MTCDVEHAIVKSKDLSIPPNPLQILGVAQASKTNLAVKRHTRVTKRDLKRLKHMPGSGVGLSVFIYTPNSKPQAAQITKIIIFIRKLVLAFASKIFPNNYLEFSLKEYFFSQLVDFLVILDQYSYKK